MKIRSLILLALLALASPAFAQNNLTVKGAVTSGHCVTFFNKFQLQDGGTCAAAAGGAPAAATYILQTANGSLSSAQAMGSLATGLVKNTTSTGVQSIIVPAAGIETLLATPSSANLLAAITDETGTGSAVFSISPTFTGTLNAATVTATGTVSAGATNGIRWTGRVCMASTSSTSMAVYQSDCSTPANVTAGTFTGARVGTTTNDDAAAGNVGEYITGSGVGVSLTSPTVATCASISLTAGDWDVTGNNSFLFGSGTTFTTLKTSISATNNTSDTNTDHFAQVSQAASAPSTNYSLGVSSVRYSLASTTTIYLIAGATFAVNTVTVNCVIHARRMR